MPNLQERLRQAMRYTRLDADRELLNEAADEIDRLSAAQPAEVTDERHQAVDQIMEQAQVFASAWALVGGRFDFGDALDDVHEAKEELREMVCSAILALRPERVPMTDDQISLEAHNADDRDWNDLRFRSSWHEGFLEGARFAESHHGITAQAKKGDE